MAATVLSHYIRGSILGSKISFYRMILCTMSPGLFWLTLDEKAPIHVPKRRRSCCRLAPILSTADLCQSNGKISIFPVFSFFAILLCFWFSVLISPHYTFSLFSKCWNENEASHRGADWNRRFFTWGFNLSMFVPLKMSATLGFQFLAFYFLFFL